MGSGQPCLAALREVLAHGQRFIAAISLRHKVGRT
jgi:hypothetical protein